MFDCFSCLIEMSIFFLISPCDYYILNIVNCMHAEFFVSIHVFEIRFMYFIANIMCQMLQKSFSLNCEIANSEGILSKSLMLPLHH